MHKIRNTKHQEILESLVGTIPPGCSEPLSKNTLRKLCVIHKWNKKAVLKDIENDTYGYTFAISDIY